MLAAIMVLLSGCVVMSINSLGNAVQGTGDRVSNSFNVINFTGLEISGAYTVIYRHSQTHAVVVEMHENLFDYLNVGVQNGVLRINSDRSFRTGRNETPHVYIYAPFLNSVDIAGAVTIQDWDTIRTDRMNINAGGSARGTMPLEIENLEVSVAGAANFDFVGTATSATITIAGAGTINAGDLQTVSAQVSIAGSGNIEIAVSDMLDASITGAGRITYIGNPQVNRSIAGAGTIRSRN